MEKDIENKENNIFIIGFNAFKKLNLKLAAFKNTRVNFFKIFKLLLFGFPKGNFNDFKFYEYFIKRFNWFKFEIALRLFYTIIKNFRINY